MSDRAELLLVADRTVSAELAERIRPHRFVSESDPYEALLAMRDRDWAAVILTAPQPEFPALCRAARRLRGPGRVFALCPPTAEPEVRPLAGDVVDDYFIYPPTRQDLAKLLPAGAEDPGPVPAAQGSLTPDEYGALVEAACSVEYLEEEIAAVVARRLGAPVRWTDPREMPPDAEILLLAEGDRARALIAEDYSPAPGRSAGALLSAIRQCLPALMRTADRTAGLHRLAVTDHLTGAYNRRYFYHRTEQILQRARREEFRVMLLLYDIDNFKRYNDTYGHGAGDQILKETAALMRQTTRSQDLVARIGGDEFAVLFWDPKPRSPGSVPPDSAYILADRFRRAVTRHEFPFLGSDATGALTISGGLASFPDDGATCRGLLRAADRGLKNVKETGKNGIHLAGPGRDEDPG